LLDQAVAHCPIFLTAGDKKKPEPCLSFNVAGRSFKPAKDHRLGELLLHLQSNLIQAHLQAI